MKASELRIGNWVNKSLKSGSGRILQTQTNVQDIVRLHENTGSFNYEPTPLTEEWLLNFGFEPDKDNAHFLNKEPFTLKEHPEGFVVWHKGHALGIVVKHVHQLQNLYFALTGEELKQEQQ
jgi:hypothetical protein